MVCCSPEPRRVTTSYSGLNQKCYQPSDCHCGYEWMHKQGTASKLQRACTTPRSGPQPFSILDGCRQMLAVALQRAKGRDGGKYNLSGNDKSSSLKWKVSSQRNFSQDFRGATQSLSPVRVHRTRGVVTYRNAPSLKLSVRQRKQSFSLGGVCDPVSIFPSRGFRLSGR